MSSAATRVAFRVDSSLAIGTGHLVRCLTLAEELRRQGCECVFVCRDLTGARLDAVRERGFALVELPAPEAPASAQSSLPEGVAHAGWLGVDPETDAEQSAEALRRRGGVDRLVVDHYALDASWESPMRALALRILAIDDLADRPHDCDWLLDQNLGASPDDYARLTPGRCKLLLGPEYLLLREGFATRRPAAPRPAEPPRWLLVYFGGSDLTGETPKALEALAGLAASAVYPERIDVILPAEGPLRDRALSIAPSLPGLVLHDHVEDMPSLMASADLALGAGGTSAWERAYLGLPSLTVIVAENQHVPASALAEAGGSRLLGSSEAVTAEDVERALEEAFAEPEGLARMSAAALRVTCGAEDGAARVGGYLLMRDEPLRAGDCELRPMDERDLDTVLLWRNSERVRSRMYEDAPIAPEEHERWFAQASRDPCQRQYVFEVRGRPLGVVSFKGVDPTAGACEWGFYMGEEHRPHGAGQAMGRLALRQAFEGLGVRAVLGEVLASNEDSLLYHESLGFERIDPAPATVERGGRPREVVRFRLEAARWDDAEPADPCLED
ncbi:MAG: UDP-2,4-diacetamido-2,4,6-trideoxy-beta-L-altropyranose hydrolase [Coriobacteriia bacterium]|nr:UDP-2,4-diacetamido-2,4,6-trideoxy-beta-L-altropyranose hydrolase [Coriobacteriia bacterium]